MPLDQRAKSTRTNGANVLAFANDTNYVCFVSETPSTRRFLRETFSADFDRLANAGTSSSIREKATRLSLPPASLGHMISGHRPVNADLVLALGRALPGVDLEQFFVSRPAGRRGGDRRRIATTAKAA
jgi:hypothetical protein